MLDLAVELEKVALEDPYFVQRKLYPNVDFYSGIILKAMGIPTSMFTVLFAVARTVGWISQWKEMIEEPGQRIGRPRQIYTGRRPARPGPARRPGLRAPDRAAASGRTGQSQSQPGVAPVGLADHVVVDPLRDQAARLADRRFRMVDAITAWCRHGTPGCRACRTRAARDRR